MTTRDEQRRFIEARAGDRCEYCRMHQALQGATFHVEHVTPISRGGVTSPKNLALACPRCNLCKADRIEILDPATGDFVSLFNPRRNAWGDHLRWDNYDIRPRSAIGNATITALDLNHPRRLQIRQAEELFDLFPP